MKALWEYLDQLKKQQALMEWDRPVNPLACEISGLLKVLEDRNDDRAVIFRNTQNLLGERSIFPVVTNLLTTRERCRMALAAEGDSKMDLVKRVAVLEQESLPPKVLSSREAPVKANILVGDKASLNILPGCRYHELDAGPFTTGVVIMRSRKGTNQEEFYEASWIKGQILGPQRTTVSLTSPHLQYVLQEYEGRGEKAPAIFCLGHHPAFELGVLAIKEYRNDDYGTIGSFMGEPLRVVASETWGDQFLVPADAEVIVEGEIIFGEREFQNPFGEWSGYYQPRMQKPVMAVTAITYRDSAICRGIFSSHPDHTLLGSLPKEGSIYKNLRRINPHVTGVHVPVSGSGRLSCYIALAKTDRSECAQVALRALSMSKQLRVAVVVDDDIDVFNEGEVVWAILTRASTDSLSLIRNARLREWPGPEQIVVDATYVPGGSVPIRNKIPSEAIEKMRRELDQL